MSNSPTILSGLEWLPVYFFLQRQEHWHLGCSLHLHHRGKQRSIPFFIVTESNCYNNIPVSFPDLNSRGLWSWKILHTIKLEFLSLISSASATPGSTSRVDILRLVHKSTIMVNHGAGELGSCTSKRDSQAQCLFGYWRGCVLSGLRVLYTRCRSWGELYSSVLITSSKLYHSSLHFLNPVLFYIAFSEVPKESVISEGRSLWYLHYSWSGLRSEFQKHFTYWCWSKGHIGRSCSYR